MGVRRAQERARRQVRPLAVLGGRAQDSLLAVRRLPQAGAGRGMGVRVHEPAVDAHAHAGHLVPGMVVQVPRLHVADNGPAAVRRARPRGSAETRWPHHNSQGQGAARGQRVYPMQCRRQAAEDRDQQRALSIRTQARQEQRDVPKPLGHGAPHGSDRREDDPGPEDGDPGVSFALGHGEGAERPLQVRSSRGHSTDDSSEGPGVLPVQGADAARRVRVDDRDARRAHARSPLQLHPAVRVLPRVQHRGLPVLPASQETPCRVGLEQFRRERQPRHDRGRAHWRSGQCARSDERAKSVHV